MNRLFLAGVTVFVVLFSAYGVGISARAQDVALVHARAVLMPGEEPVENATIVIVQGKIQAAGAGVAVPVGMRTIDALGKWVTPGLMNSDSQLGLVETGTEDTSDQAVVNGPYAEAFDVEYAINPNSTLLPVARADGLTRAMIFPTGYAGAPFNGLGAVLCLREGAQILEKAKAAVVGEVGGMVAPKSGGSRAQQWMLIRAALDIARKNASKPDGVATGPILPAALTEINVAALEPVLNGSVPMVVIAYRESDIRQAVALVDDYKIRVVLVGGEEAWRVADLLASRHIPVVLDPFASIPATYDQMGARLDNAAILDRAGVVISFKAAFVHVSYNAGIAIREGAGVAVAHGLPYAHALKALTSNAALTWGIADHYGTLAPGKDADIVIWDGDPLEPSSAPALVMVEGRQVSLETRQTKLAKRYGPAHTKDAMPPAYH